MSIIVKKIGGSLLKSDIDFTTVAAYLANIYRTNPRLVVVVSATQGTTDRLILEAEKISLKQDSARELLLSLGEQKSCALLGLALGALNIPYTLFNGNRIQILKKTEGNYVVNQSAYTSALETGIVVVSGFHVLNENLEFVNLGRGGSDFTAMLLAQALKAHRCDLVKDVPGVFNINPEWGPLGQFFKKLSFDQLLKLVDQGAPVVQKEALIFAKQHNLAFQITNLSGEGTRVE